MDKSAIDKSHDDGSISDKEKLDTLYEEFYDACFNDGYYKEKANHLELKIEELKK